MVVRTRLFNVVRCNEMCMCIGVGVLYNRLLLLKNAVGYTTVLGYYSDVGIDHFMGITNVYCGTV